MIWCYIASLFCLFSQITLYLIKHQAELLLDNMIHTWLMTHNNVLSVIPLVVFISSHITYHNTSWYDKTLLARWLTSARAYRIGGRKLCPSVCLYVKRYLLLQFCTDYNQTWINMIWAVAAKTLLSQIFHKWRKIEVNCVYVSRCAQLVSYFWNAGMHTK